MVVCNPIKILFGVMIALLLMLILAACGGDIDDTQSKTIPDAVEAAAKDLSERLNIPMKEIVYLSYTQTEWPDGCLGLAEAGEICTQMLTRGWEVVLEANGKQYTYRTDETGGNIRPDN